MQTVTVSVNAIFQPSEVKIIEGLRAYFKSFLSVVSVERAAFSGRFAVTVEDYSHGAEAVRAAFLSALLSMGYTAGEVLHVEPGARSSIGGGLSEAAVDIRGAVLSPLLFPLTLVAVVAVAYAVIQVAGKVPKVWKT